MQLHSTLPKRRPSTLWRKRLPEAAAWNKPSQTERAPELPSSPSDQPTWRKALTTAGKAAAVGALAAALMLTSVGAAEAARSGGRMGGSSGFSSRSSGPSVSSGRSYGGGSSYGSSYSGTSRSYGGYSGGGLRSAPSVGFGVGSSVMPSFFLSPFGYGYGYPAVGGFNFMSLIFWGVFAVVVQSMTRGSDSAAGYYDDEGNYVDGRVTVAKVQVGLMGSARQIQRDLERIASRANTSSPQGLHYILQETVLALMRNPDYCLYGFSQGASSSSPEKAESRFNEYSMEERGKFEAETLVNVGGRSRRGTLRRRPVAPGPQELIVVTVLVAAEGSFKLPKITSRSELRAALAKLGALRAEDIMAVEVLWTPEEEDDYFTQDDLASDYPLLNTL
ncbi:hypothetical protein N2152v2_010904 [Parachlorella kessleri]